jgi:tRNA (guanine-N7-)-methyltransferase
MRPAQLKVPFCWNNRRIVIEDGVFYCPPYSTSSSDPEFSFPSWNDPQLFGNDNPIHIEYCSGNGAWITAKAKEFPCINWVAVEKKFPRVRKIWAKAQNMELKNLITVCGEACHATAKYFLSDSFAAAYINFPDPWPKRRHTKHRLIHPLFIEQIERVLKNKAVFTLVTDDPEYSRRMLEEMRQHSAFISSHPEPYFATELPNYGSSYFEQLWREQGKIIRYHQFEKMSKKADVG